MTENEVHTVQKTILECELGNKSQKYIFNRICMAYKQCDIHIVPLTRATAKIKSKNTCNRTHLRFIYKIVIVCVQEKGGFWRANKNTTHLSEE